MSQREMNARETFRQIGGMTVAAISGGRMVWAPTNERYPDLLLPVSSGYKVRISLRADDTYTVTREMHRAGKVFVKGLQTDVYCDEVGEVCYQASSYKSYPFGSLPSEVPTNGVSRCECGNKYWRNGCCIDCGQRYAHDRHEVSA